MKKSTRETSKKTSDVVIGIHPRDLDSFDLYLIPTILVEKLGQSSISINTVDSFKNGQVPFSTDSEFYSRQDGIAGLQVEYGFTLDENYVTFQSLSECINSLRNGNSTASMIFGTNPAISEYNFVVLTDDKNFWPPYDLAPYTRQNVLDENTGMENALNEVIPAFPQSQSEARQETSLLNAKVDFDSKTAEAAATEWLVDKGLITQ